MEKFKTVSIDLIKKYGYFILFLITGLIIFSWPMLKSGFDLMPGNSIEIKSFNYVLEHSWMWIHQIAPHKYFWDAPIYYPDANTLAYNDTLMGIMPLYWIIRLFFKNPQTSLQILLLALCVLNYSTFYYLLNKNFKFSSLASSFGSFIFAFSIMRYYRISDVNYFTEFFTILAIIFFIKINKNLPRMKNHIYFLISSIFLLLQFYTCFALGFFAVFVAFWALLIALLPKTSRDKIIEFFVNFYKMFLFYAGVVIIMLAPLAYHFVSVGSIHTLDDVLSGISDYIVWIRNVSILDSIFFKNFYYIGEASSAEFSASLGIFTTILAFFGLWKLKYAKGLPILLIILIYFASCNFSAIRFWKVFYIISPGSESISSIIRISFVALIIFAIGIGALINYFQNTTIKNKVVTNVLLILTLLLLTIEQIPFSKDPNSAWVNYGWSKKEFRKEIKEISKDMPKDCRVFNLQYIPYNYEKFGQNDINYKDFKRQKLQNVNGMWVAVENHKYTLNGYNGILKEPPQYDESHKEICTYSVGLDYDKI